MVAGKKANKEALCELFQLDSAKPLICFIGRLVGDKGADLLPEIIRRSLSENDNQLSYIILGSADPHIEWELQNLKNNYSANCNVYIGYNEKIAHQIYAGSDFLLMPSRVEPCGLNQLYSLRYGTVPIVRSVGGLKDTVIDFGDEGGYGIRFIHPSVWDVCYSAGRASELYNNVRHLNSLRRLMMKLDYSWDNSAQQYLDLYTHLK